VAKNAGFGSFGHLAVRFLGALDPRGPKPEEERWAQGWLLPGEVELWARMSGPDRRHAAGVAREVSARLGPGDPPRPIMAAALLHDVGKVVSGLGTFSRVGVTLAALGLGRARLTVGSDVAPDSTQGRGSTGASGSTQGPDSTGASGSTGAAGTTRWRRRVSDYLCHDRLGADLLEAAGSHADTVAWAGEHHLPTQSWSLDRRFADALKAADGD
jgi:hypothetical protein